MNSPARCMVANTSSFWTRLYGWACELLYHQAAWSYDGVSWIVSGGRWAHWRRMILPYLAPGPVLELGFGPGHLQWEGRSRGYTMFGVDRSPQMAARVARRRDMADPPPFIAVAGGEHLPFAAGAFQTVAATFPAPFILEERTLVECYRVLQPGGRLVVLGLWVQAKEGIWRHLPVFYGRPSESNRASIAQRVAAAGFAVEELVLDDGELVVGGLVAQKGDGA